MHLARRLSIALVLLAAPFAAQAQKKALTQTDWDRWQSIQSPTLSSNGKWVAYTLAPQVGDGEFVVRSTTGNTEYRVPVGYISRPNNTPGGERGAGAGGGGRGGAPAGGVGGPFTADGRYAFVTTQPTKEEVEKTQREQAAGRGGRAGAGAGAGAAPPTPPANPNVIMRIDLSNGEIKPMTEMRSYRLAQHSGKWMTYTPVPDSAAAGDTTAAAGAAAPAGGGRGAGGRGGRGGAGGQAAPAGGTRRTYGSTVVLRNIDTGADEKLTDVLAHTFDDSAKVLAYTVASRDSTKDGVYVRNLNTGATQTVMSGPGNYRAFAFDRAQQQFVFFSDRDEFGKDSARSTLYYGTLKTGSATPIITHSALPPGMRFTASASASFTRAGNALTFAIAPPPADTIPSDSLVGKAVFDLWHWQDPQLQPQQKLRVAADRNPTYQAVFDLATRKVVRLTDEDFPNVTLSDDAKVGVASTSVPYAVQAMWGDSGNDIYYVDPATGNKKLIRKKISGSAQLSVGAKYISFFDEGAWFTYNIATGKTTDITSSIKGVRFDQETWSTPSTPSAWGIAGWTKDDRSILINDRFDIWEIDPAGVRPPVIVTDSVGRRENITLRITSLGRPEDERFIDPAKPLILSAFDEDTKESGFYQDRLGVKLAPEKIVMSAVRYGAPQKARNADVYMLTKSTFIDFPNLWVGPSLTSLNRITDANAWQKDYNWGTAELVEWLSTDGVPRQGILFKPEDFDPKKKYPMISYFYEDLSDGLHAYVPPTGRNVINATHYASNGYLIFQPDIYYETGYPGPSAMKSIVPGVQMLLQRGYVDPKGLGLQGQSWGGYQATYMITQTQMFAAAMAGAPVGNMTSAYGGIRWGSGLARAFQYETGQSRLGKSIWDGMQLYLENSPLFWLDRVTTPLFIMHNDQDDAVPWYQGIEIFVGMRRLGKEVYMINYNNDVHNPASRANQKDMAMRMEQFFDNKLKGAPAPDWMVNGIPAKDKGKDQVGRQ